MSEPIYFSDATRLAELIRTREVSSVEVVQAHLDQIQAVNPAINAIVTIADGALAAAADAAVNAGDELGGLDGVPFTVKDSIDTAGVMTQRGSLNFKGRTPDADATSVARMKKAGGILLAKTNLPEFSYQMASGRQMRAWTCVTTEHVTDAGHRCMEADGLHLSHQPATAFHVLAAEGRAVDPCPIGTELAERIEVLQEP
jgi:aspartyl-tRNA(Asn)/glutamyl-tRNA(Gln) amidotransferase subunit A